MHQHKVKPALTLVMHTLSVRLIQHAAACWQSVLYKLQSGADSVLERRLSDVLLGFSLRALAVGEVSLSKSGCSRQAFAY